MIDDIDKVGIRKLDGGLLLVLRELGRTPQTTEVARRLGLSQSAISHALSRLRDVFDDPLFIRRPHGLEPTRRAEELMPRIDALIDLVSAAIQRRERFEPTQTERRFVISAQAGITVAFGGSLIETLRTKAPRAALLVKEQNGVESLDAVRRGEVDIAVGRFNATPIGLQTQRLLEDRYCVVARQGHPRISGMVDWVAYAEIGHIYSGPSGAPGAVEDEIPSPTLVAALAVVPSWMTVLALVARSDALATVPRRIAESVADLFQLQVLDPPFEPYRMVISSVRRADADDPAIDWLEEEIARALA